MDSRDAPSKLRAACERFNQRFPVGTKITVYRGLIGENPIVAKVRYEAEVLSGHTPVVWVEGVSGCIALSHTAPYPRLGAFCSACEAIPQAGSCGLAGCPMAALQNTGADHG